MKKQATDWDKIFAKYITGKGLVSKIYNKFSKLDNKITCNPI